MTTLIDWNEVDPARRYWYVLHVKPRTEKKMASFLAAAKLWHHLPLYLKIRKVQRRKVRTELPLFPGYVFAKLNADDRLAMLKTNLIVHAIFVREPRALIHQLRMIAHAGRRATSEMKRTEVYREGDYIRIEYGPLRGTEGYIKRDAGGAKIVLNVLMLNQAVEISVNPADCVKIPKP